MLLFCDSFATTTDLSVKYQYQSGASVVSAAGRFDSAGIQLGQAWTKTFTNRATIVAGCAFYVVAGSGTSTGSILVFGDALSSPQVNLYVTVASGGVATFQAQRNGTNLGSAASATVPFSTWHYIEMQATIDPSAGAVSVWLDGVQIINLTGQNTRATSNSYVNTVALESIIATFGNCYADDFYVIDTTGSYNNARLGDIKVAGSVPTGNGTLQNYALNAASWVASTATAIGTTILDSNSNLQRCTANTSDTKTGASAPTWATGTGTATTDNHVTWTCLGAESAYLLVSENPEDGDSSYLSDSTVNDQSRYTFPSISGASVKAVMVYLCARKDDSATRSLRAVAKSGSTVGDNGSDFAMSSSYQNFAGLFETDPNTSAPWSVSAVNSAEFGVKTTA